MTSVADTKTRQGRLTSKSVASKSMVGKGNLRISISGQPMTK